MNLNAGAGLSQIESLGLREGIGKVQVPASLVGCSCGWSPGLYPKAQDFCKKST